MGSREFAIVDYKKGNLKSVERGLAAAGADVVVTDSPERIAEAAAVVLPGVGAYADAMGALRELGLDEAVLDAIARDIPFLGICLGLQLMFEGGEEHAEDGAPVEGLGVIPGIVKKLASEDAEGNHYKIPHVGWNSVDFEEVACPLFDGIRPGEYFYFTHSYAAPESDATVATTTHSITFPCAVQKGNAFAVQFHPEKSSDAGAKMLQNFVRYVEGD